MCLWFKKDVTSSCSPLPGCCWCRTVLQIFFLHTSSGRHTYSDTHTVSVTSSIKKIVVLQSFTPTVISDGAWSSSAWKILLTWLEPKTFGFWRKEFYLPSPNLSQVSYKLRESKERQAHIWLFLLFIRFWHKIGNWRTQLLKLLLSIHGFETSSPQIWLVQMKYSWNVLRQMLMCSANREEGMEFAFHLCLPVP